MSDVDLSKKKQTLNEAIDYLICLICFESPSNAHLCPNCSKLFCLACITEWLANNQKCPNCCELLHESQLIKCRWVKDLTENLDILQNEFEEEIENKRAENDRLEKLEKDRLEKERFQKEKIENERIEKERLEKKKLENERIEKERFNKLQIELNSEINNEPENGNTSEIFVSNLQKDMDQNIFYDMFRTFGAIEHAYIIMRNGHSQGYGFVKYNERDDALKAIKFLNNFPLTKDQTLKVMFSKGKPKKKSIPNENEDILNLLKNLKQKDDDNKLSKVLELLKLNELTKTSNGETEVSNAKKKNRTFIEKEKKKDKNQMFKERLKLLNLNSYDTLPVQSNSENRSISNRKSSKLDFKVYVGNLHEKINKQILIDLFKPFGRIIHAKIIQARHNYGFVSFSKESQALDAIKQMNNKIIFGNKIVVELANEKQYGTYSESVCSDTISEISIGDVLWRNKEKNKTTSSRQQMRETRVKGTIINATEDTNSEISIDEIQRRQQSEQLKLAETFKQLKISLKSETKVDGGDPSNDFTKIFVNNLPRTVNSNILKNIFSTCGTIVQHNLVVRNNKKIGFITFSTKQEALNAVKIKNNTFIFGQRIFVDLAKTSKEINDAASDTKSVSSIHDNRTLQCRQKLEKLLAKSSQNTKTNGSETIASVDDKEENDVVEDNQQKMKDLEKLLLKSLKNKEINDTKNIASVDDKEESDVDEDNQQKMKDLEKLLLKSLKNKGINDTKSIESTEDRAIKKEIVSVEDLEKPLLKDLKNTETKNSNKLNESNFVPGILIKNLNMLSCEKLVKEVFEKFGSITKIKMIPVNNFTQNCLIRYKDIKSARDSKVLDQVSYFGQTLSVSIIGEMDDDEAKLNDNNLQIDQIDKIESKKNNEDETYKRLIIENLNQDFDEDILKELFTIFGQIENINIIHDRAYVTFAKHEDAKEAIENINNLEILGQTLKVNIAKSSKERLEEIKLYLNKKKALANDTKIVQKSATGGELETYDELETGGELGTYDELETGGELGTYGELETGGELGTYDELETGGELGTYGELETGGELGTGGELKTYDELETGGELGTYGELETYDELETDDELKTYGKLGTGGELEASEGLKTNRKLGTVFTMVQEINGDKNLETTNLPVDQHTDLLNLNLLKLFLENK